MNHSSSSPFSSCTAAKAPASFNGVPENSLWMPSFSLFCWPSTNPATLSKAGQPNLAPYRSSCFLNTKDKQFVETLAAELEAEKIEPWLCEVDVEFGANFVAKIEEGLREADLTILFWSPEAARSGWTRLEWTSVTAREISESRTRLGVVLLRDCPVPELLRVKHRIDARTDPEKGRLG